MSPDFFFQSRRHFFLKLWMTPINRGVMVYPVFPWGCTARNDKHFMQHKVKTLGNSRRSRIFLLNLQPQIWLSVFDSQYQWVSEQKGIASCASQSPELQELPKLSCDYFCTDWMKFSVIPIQGMRASLHPGTSLPMRNAKGNLIHWEVYSDLNHDNLLKCLHQIHS